MKTTSVTWFQRPVDALAVGIGVSLLVACTGVLGGEGNESPKRSSEEASSESDRAHGVLTGADGQPISYEPAATPLARLTNDEFFVSAAEALGIPKEAEGLAGARSGFAAEARVAGLTNDVQVQLLTQVALSSFASLTSAAADVLLQGLATQVELRERLQCDDSGAFSVCLTDFGLRLMARAHRKTPTAEDRQTLESTISQFEAILQREASAPDSLASDLLRVKTIIRTVLISPDFLLVIEKGLAEGGVQVVSSEEAAVRLSYLLVGHPPDEELRAAAEAGELQDAESRRRHATRLLESEAGRTRIESVMMGWLGVSENLVEPESVAALSDFIGDWFVSRGPFSDFYEAPIPVEHLDGGASEEAFGVLGMDGFLGSHTFPPTPAFITRGVFLVERLLCTHLPADVPADALDSDEPRTDLSVFEVHNKQPCATCHLYFDNYGAALHQFDGETSRYAPGPTELGSGFELLDLGGISGTVNGPHDLAETMAASERAPRCMTELWYRNAMRRSLDEDKDDHRVVDVLIENWKASGDSSLKSLLLELVSSEQFVAFVP